MFPLSKLHELSPRTRMRKASRILHGLEVDAAAGRPPDPGYLRGLLGALEVVADAACSQVLEELCSAVAQGRSDAVLLRGINALRHALLAALGAEPAEWDLVSPQTGRLDRAGLRILPFMVYLEDIRSPFNVGSLFRTAEAFGARGMLISPRTPLPTHPRALRTSLGAADALPWERCGLERVAALGNSFALELGGTPIDEFIFPHSGVVMVGSEELGLSPEALRLADTQRGRVSIPLAGAKRSLNVSVAFGILLHAWQAAVSPR
jgi:TrmH family RNA methyltransferase